LEGDAGKAVALQDLLLQVRLDVLSIPVGQWLHPAAAFQDLEARGVDLRGHLGRRTFGPGDRLPARDLDQEVVTRPRSDPLAGGADLEAAGLIREGEGACRELHQRDPPRVHCSACSMFQVAAPPLLAPEAQLSLL